MRRPEPLPAFPPTLSGPQSGPLFTRVDEVNGAVITVIHSLSANGQYTGVGSVQSELFRTEFRDSARYLGPVYTLPVAQELCEVTTFHPRVCEAFSGGTVDTVYRITTERLFEELNQFVCQNRYRLPSSQARQINRWWESVFTQHMLRLFGEQDVPRNATELTFSRLGVYGIRIKQFAKLIEVRRRSYSKKLRRKG
ncbi:unnamed protein product [Dibothriocephalus latus]|uniref:Uncharacterized protein n=1 Tax=Dibothriocephalus latus TaxID=60516 RepID=A0A3P7MZH5_DIBLA|nr:unnamed protein product [Dibothriocephalus latus]